MPVDVLEMALEENVRILHRMLWWYVLGGKMSTKEGQVGHV